MTTHATEPDVAPTRALAVRAPTRPTEPFRRGHPVAGTPYVVVRFLGQGGMGEVYEVEHRELGRRCVLKVLHRNHGGRHDLAARMRAEARTLAAMRHPNLVDVFDLGVTGDARPFFAMELLSGRDLKSELARVGVMAVPAALGLVAQALEGLGAAHAAGVIHRDVKLENLFLCDDGTLKVLDFGIAKSPDGDGLTGTRGVAGTPRTMAPEQCKADAVDPRTDLYATGLVLYELVAGRGPFDELCGNDHALRFAHCMRAAPPPSHLAPQPIPRGIDAAILRAIAKSPDERFQTAAEMADALLRLRGERRRRRAPPPRPSFGSGARPGAMSEPTRRPAFAARAPIGLALVALGLAAISLALTFARGGHHAPAPAGTSGSASCERRL